MERFGPFKCRILENGEVVDDNAECYLDMENFEYRKGIISQTKYDPVSQLGESKLELKFDKPIKKDITTLQIQLVGPEAIKFSVSVDKQGKAEQEMELEFTVIKQS